jgi:hypothetical protein
MMCGRKVIKTLGSQKSSINVINMESICREVTDLEYVNSKDTLAQAKYQDIGKCHTAKMFDIVTHWLCCCVTRKNKPGGGSNVNNKCFWHIRKSGDLIPKLANSFAFSIQYLTYNATGSL